ncbi:hypothetical protein JL720_13049 [Aureococcus anophagefferens]|nr:hypothetical protein JL720_13049 [Aureococcus anophagefferens]
MPGAATGSYSRNLQYLFSHGAVVLVWRHAAIEWYYRHLVDGVHYVAVDAASLPATLAARATGSAAPAGAALRRAPRGAAPVDRWAATLGPSATARRAGRRPSTRRPRAREPRLADSYARCAKCEITTKRGNTIAKFVGLVPKKRAA